MPCSSTYCLSNTGYPTFDDVYFSAGTHNSELYWTGQTNGLVIYYNTGSTQWCLSTVLDGTCLLSGQSPCFNPCPDLDDVYFSSGACPTPTPSPTQNCSSLDFSAIFDCDFQTTQTPTPTPTTSVTPTPTPTPTNPCNVVINATIQSVSPTPTPTPTLTPTPSSPISRDCTFEASVTFNTIDDSIVCPYSYQFQDCYNGEMYYTTDQITTPTGNTITKFEIYQAIVNGDISCVSYVGINNNTIGIDNIRLDLGPYGFSTNGDCILCFQSIPPTPTPTTTPTTTPTPTPTLTSTVPVTPTPSSTQVCTRPSGLTQHLLINGIGGQTVPSQYLSFSTGEIACNAWNYYTANPNTVTLISSRNSETTSIEVGNVVYSNYNQTSCVVIPSGTYWVLNSNAYTVGFINGNPFSPSVQIITIGSNGIITNESICTLTP